MRLPVIILILTAATFGCGNDNRKADSADIENNGATPENPEASKGPKGTPKFEKTMHDFGNIVDGEQVQHKFKFRNTGKGELVVANVEASCGCTTPEWTREIIPSGGEGFILATFNSSGRGEKNGLVVKKSITVTFSNSTIEQMELSFQSNIIKKD